MAEIRIFPLNFAPQGWAFCDGQIMSIAQNTALFSLLGTTYGGDGVRNFALPDMRGNAPMHRGQGPGLAPHDLGESGGSDTVTLLASEIPVHSHALQAQTTDAATSGSVAPNNVFAPSTGGTLYQSAGGVSLSAQTIAPVGGGQPHNN